jgi:hypothetical protein
MKRLSEIRSPITEIMAQQDPPTVLILRRKGIRLFPNNQRVASYRNDNLDLEVAIPYNPATLGQRRIATVGTAIGEETLVEEAFQEGDRVKAGHEVGTVTDPRDGKFLIVKHDSDNTHHSYHSSDLEHHIDEETLEEAGKYTPEQLKIRRDRRTLKGDVDRNARKITDHEHGMRFSTPKEARKHAVALPGAQMHHRWSVERLLDHIKQHGPTSDLDESVDEEIVNEAIKGWKHAHTDIAKFRRDAGNAAAGAKLVRAKKDGSESGMHDATTHHKTEADARAKHEYIKSINPGRDVKHHLYVNGEHRGLLEETIQEATIHSLHSIARSKTPATVRFRNGSSAMVHHGTAARVMKLHSLMRKGNKHKVESLVNSSPDGLKKVVDFIDTHLK